ncbi:MAG TPA: Flp family type IVb pilin [Hyphomicrobium sp.]|nr:Flp family type IVb pilin [Hyphomicrobium sp.]
MFDLFKNFLHDDRGTTAVEYALIGVVVGVGIIAALRATSTSLDLLLQNVAAAINESNL